MTNTVRKVYPWRRVARTTFQSFVTFCAIVPFIYSAASNGEPGAATGLAAAGLGVAAAVTRVMALPQVEKFLQKFIPVLAALPPDTPTTTE